MTAHYLRLWRELAPNHRLGAMALVIGNIAAALLEVLGLALFGAVLLRITGATASAFWLTHVMGAQIDLRRLVVICALVYTAKNLLMTGLAWLEARLAFGVQAHLSGKVLAATLAQDYEMASREEAGFSANLLTGGMAAISHNLILPGLTMLAEVILMTALVLFLLITQPLFSAAMLGALGGVAALLVLLSRRLVLGLGRERHQVEGERLLLLTGIFGHLREMYVYSAGLRAVALLEGQLSRWAASSRGFQMLATTPRFALEMTLLGALLTVVYLRADGGLGPELVASIGVFGGAGFRLLLGINRVVGSVQGMRFSGAVVEQVANVLARPAGPAPAGRGRSGATEGSLWLDGVGYAYTAGRPVLQDIHFELPRRTLIAIKGRSGAGKSTLLEVMAGLRTPTSGTVTLDGVRIVHKQALVGRVAYAGQRAAVFPDTIRANVALGLAPDSIDDEAVWRALARAHLDSTVRALPGQLDHMLSGGQHDLSGGQVQRLALARALYMDCDYVLLDEPTAALDLETEAQLLSTFRELATTTGVVVVSHRPRPIEAADAVWELTEGRLIPLSPQPSSARAIAGPLVAQGTRPAPKNARS